MLTVKKEKALLDQERVRAYVYVRRETGTQKHFYNHHDLMSSIPNLPPYYFMKINNRLVEDQPLRQVQGETIEITPTTRGGSAQSSIQETV